MPRPMPPPEPIYRCTRPLCAWRGPKSDTVQRAVGEMLHCFCPQCLHPARRAGSALAPAPAKATVPDQDRTSPTDGDTIRAEIAAEELELYLEQPRICSRCGWAGKVRDFPSTMARGKRRVRAWCKACLRQYYKDRKDGKS